MQGRLNIFQMTMLKWDEFHPYNAIGLLKVPGRLDPQRLKSALNRSIERRGIGRFRLDRKLRSYSYPGGTYTADLRVISGAEDTLKAVHNEVELQLNMRFVEAGGEINPFRFFAVDGPGFFYLGIVYFHVIADGYSLAQLAKDIAHAYQSDDDEALPQCTDLCPDTYRSMFRRKPVSFFLPSLSIPNFLSGLRRSTKPYQMYHVNDQQLGFRLLRCDAPVAATLTAVAHTWGVTQNDVLLALVFKVIAPFVSEKKVRDNKKRMALGAAISISRELGIKLRGTFGVFLSSFTVSHMDPASRSLEALSKDINRQTVRIRKRRLYLVSLFEKWLALKFMPLMQRKQQMKFYPKNYPLWAALTNMNFKTLMDDLDGGREIELSSTVSTGPSCPIAFSVIRVRETINAGISFRLAVFSRAEVEQIASDFLRYARELTAIPVTPGKKRQEGP